MKHDNKEKYQKIIYTENNNYEGKIPLNSSKETSKFPQLVWHMLLTNFSPITNLSTSRRVENECKLEEAK